jgi:Mrp family chromosome partitioning ATPase
VSKNFELLQRIERDTAQRSRSDLKGTAASFAAENGRADERDKQLTKLVHRLLATDLRNAPRVIVFADVDQQNGSSWICCRTAELISRTTTVCVVDANLHSPAVHAYFGVENATGLAKAMYESFPVERAVQMSSTGPAVMSAGEGEFEIGGKTSDVLNAIMASLRNDFDYVLIDAPPIHSYSQSAVLGALADGLILIIQANSTKRYIAKNARKELQAWNVNVLGAILNNEMFPIPEKILRKL